MTTSLKELATNLRKMPVTVAIKVAAASADLITAQAQASAARSETPEGTPWAKGADGQTVTLRDTGSLLRFLKYRATGTKLRASLGVRYAKYQIGKRPVLPRPKRALPASYVKLLSETVAKVARGALK